jgi:hypothetical protein
VRDKLEDFSAGEKRHIFRVDIYGRRVEQRQEFSDVSDPIQIHTSVMIVRHCLASDLFSHLPTSKLVRYRFTRDRQKYLDLFSLMFDFLRFWKTAKRSTRKRELLKAPNATFFAQAHREGPLQRNGRAGSLAGHGPPPEGETDSEAGARRSRGPRSSPQVVERASSETDRIVGLRRRASRTASASRDRRGQQIAASHISGSLAWSELSVTTQSDVLAEAHSGITVAVVSAMGRMPTDPGRDGA